MTATADPVLIVIDVQRGFVNDATRHVPARVTALQHRYGRVIATRFVNPPGSQHRRLIGWQRFAPGSGDTALAFEPAAHVRITDKTTYSCLTGDCRALLAGCDEVHLCGIATDNCVLASAIALFEAGLRPVVLEDACASHAGADYHAWGLRILRRLIGAAQVRSADQ